MTNDDIGLAWSDHPFDDSLDRLPQTSYETMLRARRLAGSRSWSCRRWRDQCTREDADCVRRVAGRRPRSRAASTPPLIPNNRRQSRYDTNGLSETPVVKAVAA